MTEPIEPDLRTVLRRLKLSRMLDTLPERLLLARQNKTPHQDFLLLVLSDETQRRDTLSSTLGAQKARLEPDSHPENWDPTARVHFDQALLAELASPRFIESHHHLAIVGQVGVGKNLPRSRSRTSRLSPRVFRPRSSRRPHAQVPQARPTHPQLRIRVPKAPRSRASHHR